MLEMRLYFTGLDTENHENNNTKQQSQTDPNISKIHKWDQQKADSFSENINVSLVQEINSYLDSLKSEITQDHINEVTQKVSTIYSRKNICK